MLVVVNGEPRELPRGVTIDEVVGMLGTVPAAGRGVAVALSGEVVPRGAWSTTALHDGARIEVVAAVQGG